MQTEFHKRVDFIRVHMEEFQHRYTLTLPDNLEFPWVERILRLNLGGYNLTQRLDQNSVYISMDIPLKPGHRKDFETEGFKVTER